MSSPVAKAWASQSTGPGLILRELTAPCVFLLQIYVHLKEGSGPDGLDALKNKPQLHGMVAKNLCRNAAGKNYIIFTGPSITSLTLFEEFEKQGLSGCEQISAQSLPHPCPRSGGRGWGRRSAGVSPLGTGCFSLLHACTPSPPGHWTSGASPGSGYGLGTAQCKALPRLLGASFLSFMVRPRPPKEFSWCLGPFGLL